MIQVHFTPLAALPVKPRSELRPAQAFNTGARGEPATLNPHQATSPEWAAWMAVWEDGWMCRRHQFER